MVQVILFGLAAGVGAALLFMAPFSGTSLAVPLFALTGLPLAIAGLGWGTPAAIAGAAAGAAIISGLVHWLSAAMFVLVFGMPLAGLTRLSLLSRTTDETDPQAPREWYPAGRLLAYAAFGSAGAIVMIGLLIGFDPQSLATQLTDAFVEWSAGTDPTAAPTADQIAPIMRLNVALLPVTTPVLALVVVVVDLWLGAEVARRSGRLQRPRDRIWTITLPSAVPIGFAVAFVLAFVPGPFGQTAQVFAAALGAAVAMLGLAVLHTLTAGMTGRAALLAVTYALVVLSGLPLILFALLGIGESVFHLRARRFGGAPPQ